MVEQIFGALFLATLFTLPAAVLFGVALLSWPGSKARHAQVAHHAPARA